MKKKEDHWRIVYKKFNSDFGPYWDNQLQRKTKFLAWEYWKSYGTGPISKLEKIREKCLEKERQKFMVLKEWK